MDKKCLWCESETPKTAKGWIPFKHHNSMIPDFLFFCSKKCLTAATINGNGKTLDINKLVKKQRSIERKKKSANMRDLMQKEKLDNKDLKQFFLCLTAKQKKALALVGLIKKSRWVHGNPKQLMAEINDIAKDL